MNYGIEIYSSACPSKLKALEVIQNSALRIITGLPRSTLISSLQFESNFPTIHQSIDFCIIKYFYKIQLFPNTHILHDLLRLQRDYIKSFQWVTFPHKCPFILRAEKICDKYNLQSDILSDNQPYFPYPWLGLGKFISTDFVLQCNKQAVSGTAHVTIFNDLLDTKYCNFCRCFTDGSKTTEAVASAVYVENISMTMSWRIASEHSILMAELFAIYNCLLWIFGQTYYKNIVIFSDSLVAINMISKYIVKSYRVIITRIQKLLFSICSKNITVVLQWIPSHTGIAGNELVDIVAKNACHYEEFTALSLEFHEHLSVVRSRFREFNLTNWSRIKNTTCFSRIVTDISKWTWISSGNRHCDVLMAKIRSGVLNVNAYLFLLNLIDSPNCIYCVNEIETIQHYILECPRHVLARHKLFSRLNELGVTQNNISIPILLSGTDFSPNKWRKIMYNLYTYFSDTGKLKSL